ncbi:helix-turn-helix transcriptional regulator [Loigolactobacillus iwatensis]|uniref:helix-turn-helix transcriptional regulator n=1 Tax=Loigolactobacillus iwatensis TaxID=1267156 RepID=UPI000F7F961D|nr:YafY family protein [Loigolactobacillus iwatensis]
MRIERLIALVMVLLEHKIISAQKLADLFHVSKRTIIRDMETLSLANVPIYALRGANGGYGIMPTYKFDKRLLAVSDLENILTALNGFENLLLSDDLKATMAKIQSMVPQDIAPNGVSISFHSWKGRNELTTVLNNLQAATKDHFLVRLAYIDGQGVKTTRIIEPYQLQAREASWYLRAYSLNRADYRTFKLARIIQATTLNKHFAPRSGALATTTARRQPKFKMTTIKIRIDNIIRDHFVERFGTSSLTKLDAAHDILEITVPQHEEGYRYLANFGSHLKILAPDNYIADFKLFLTRLLAQY